MGRGANKKVIVLMISIIFFVTIINPTTIIGIKTVNDNKTNYYKASSPINNKSWTFIVYLDGDYEDLETNMIEVLNEMELVGSTSEVNVVVQADDNGIWGNQTKRFYIEQDNDLNTIISPVVFENTSEKNMADPQTLIDFVCWTVDNYPAENYCLTISDHGQGWMGICFDQTSNDKMNLEGLREAFSDIYSHLGGKKLDIVLFAACNMGMIEVFYTIKEYIDISIASEDQLTVNYISYKGILENITNMPMINNTEFAQKIIDTSYNTIDGKFYHRYFGLYMNKIEYVKDGVNELALALLDNMPAKDQLDGIYRYSACKDGDNNIVRPHDIYRFADIISILIGGNNIKEKAIELRNCIDPLVIRPYEGENHYVSERLNGISIYFPPDEMAYSSAYDDLNFAQNTLWDEFLKKYYSMNRERDDFYNLFQSRFPFIYKFLNRNFLLQNIFYELLLKIKNYN